MDNVKTVDGSAIRTRDPLLEKQKADVSKMRTVLLCSQDSSTSAIQALQNVTILRVYHQVTRIVRYLEMMDKLEEKLYESIEASIDNFDPSSPMTMQMLLSIQEKLQKNMIESHKLLEPYLTSGVIAEQDMVPAQIESNSEDSIIPKQSRDRIRESAQTVLMLLEGELDQSAESDE